MCVSLCICVSMRLCVYLGVCVCLCIYASMCICLYICVCMCVYVYMFVYICVCLCMCVCVCVFICVSMCVCVCFVQSSSTSQCDQGVPRFSIYLKCPQRSDSWISQFGPQTPNPPTTSSKTKTILEIREKEDRKKNNMI